MTEPRKRHLLIIVIIASMVPAIFLPHWPTLVSLKSMSLYGAAIFGYIGIVVLLWSYMLGAKSVAAIVFKDMAPVLSVHKWLGKYGTLAIFIHPLLIVYSYGENLLYTAVPDLATRFERHVTLGRFAFLVTIVIWITSALLRDRIGFRPWRYIHLLGYVILPFGLLHVPDVGSQYMAHTALKAYYFSLVVAFGIFTLLRMRGLLNIDKSPYVIVNHTKLVSSDPAVHLLRLRPERDALAPKPGQYIYLKDGAISEEHPFSVFTYDAVSGEIAIAYRTFGRFTTEIARRPVGTRMWLAGPYGTFTGAIEDNPLLPTVFIAGGIGVTPMIRHLAKKVSREQWLFYANRTKESAPLLDELRRLLGQRLVAVYSRQSDGLEQRDENGHINAILLKKYLKEPSAYQYYICGSTSMMKGINRELQTLEVPKHQIHSEAFSW